MQVTTKERREDSFVAYKLNIDLFLKLEVRFHVAKKRC